MNETIDEEIREIVEETTKWHKLFESFCFKSKFIIERQCSLLKKLQAENNIVKNENSQLKCTNQKLISRLRSRLAPRMSPGVSIAGTCLRDEDAELESAETPLSPNIFSPQKPINSPIFPNLVQTNLDKEGEKEDETVLDGIQRLEDATLRKTPQKEPQKESLFTEKVDEPPKKDESTSAPKTPKKTPKKLTSKSPAKSKPTRKGMTPKKSKRALHLPPKSPDVKRMKQLKMDYFSPAKEKPSPAKSPRPKSPAQSPFKMPKSPRSRFFVRIEPKESSTTKDDNETPPAPLADLKTEQD